MNEIKSEPSTVEIEVWKDPPLKDNDDAENDANTEAMENKKSKDADAEDLGL